MEDITLTPMGITINKAEDGSHAQLVILSGIPLPIEDPNTGAPIHIPTKQTRVPLGKDSALQLGNALIELGEALSEPSRIQVASSLSGVEQAVNLDNKLKAVA